jgi:hypothetical protein
MAQENQIETDPSELARKKYLQAGLYMDNVAQFDIQAPAAKKVLPLPSHQGAWYLNQEIDFTLPYNIYFKYKNNKINIFRDPPPYTRIRSSEFDTIDSKTVHSFDRYLCGTQATLCYSYCRLSLRSTGEGPERLFGRLY